MEDPSTGSLSTVISLIRTGSETSKQLDLHASGRIGALKDFSDVVLSQVIIPFLNRVRGAFHIAQDGHAKVPTKRIGTDPVVSDPCTPCRLAEDPSTVTGGIFAKDNDFVAVLSPDPLAAFDYYLQATEREMEDKDMYQGEDGRIGKILHLDTDFERVKQLMYFGIQQESHSESTKVRWCRSGHPDWCRLSTSCNCSLARLIPVISGKCAIHGGR